MPQEKESNDNNKKERTLLAWWMSSYLQSTSSTISYPVPGLNSRCKAWVIKKFFLTQQHITFQTLTVWWLWCHNSSSTSRQHSEKCWTINKPEAVTFSSLDHVPIHQRHYSWLSYHFPASCWSPVQWIHSAEFSEANILALHAWVFITWEFLMIQHLTLYLWHCDIISRLFFSCTKGLYQRNVTSFNSYLITKILSSVHADQSRAGN